MHSHEERLRPLMLAALAGDARSYHEMLSAAAPLLRIYFRRRLGNAGEDIEDLVQETLIAIHTRRATYDGVRPFTAWMYAMARYKLADLLRRGQAEISLDGFEEVLSGGDFEAAAMARMDVDALLASLPAKQARAIRDTKLEGLSVAEAAATEGLTVADVKVSVHRGLKQLALRLKDK